MAPIETQPLLPKSLPSPTTVAQEPSKPRGANRSTKVAGKLKVLPEEEVRLEIPSPRTGVPKPSVETVEESDEEADEEDEGELEEAEPEDVETYNQIALIPEGTARRDALRLTKKKAKALPRVTAYATCSSYRLPDLLKFFNARRESYHTNARLIDEVIYTPYAYELPSSTQNPNHPRSQTAAEGDLLGVPELANPNLGANGEDGDVTMHTIKQKRKRSSKWFEPPTEAEIFIFEYGTVVIWGMSEAQEKRFLSSIKRFEVEKLAPDDIEMEDLNYYYANYSRIYNDVITLRKGSSYMTKLSLSHALSQSVKISLFESLISATIEETKDIPEIMGETGKIGMPHKEIMRKMGELFLLRTNINSVGSVLDSPEVFWTYPDLQPLYDAARSYLEIPQRINLLNTRVEVLQDMLQLLKESVSSRHSERLEQIVIALIGVEIVLGIITILVDLFL
ncbi:DUF155-domain-containing protein [Gloeophyllum trabeum ATCC 11539]|uniref:DUF155-domain-containing protein n=1 Tax=Gloeophyllum trabeum (strain ATCC 11539 / FP-39264 / Madison 617) TaxID=670483 RepID=S7Q259_GLOTA|nr:DUF155-domain-containing protein [Gloeophyllum trabeum ATCC 11539]EPQ53653.1 DUF155-domain-containing protein [Gloeophyllum trabeum ATCC 11539]